MFNLHGDSEMSFCLDLANFACDDKMRMKAWKLIWVRCERLGLRYAFYC